MDKLKKILPFIVPPLVVMLIMGFAFYRNDLYPFGDGTVSWCDMSQQVIPLLTDFKDILTGKDGIFLNFHNAGGMNLWGVFFFFIASPYTLLVLLADKADVIYLVNIMTVLKLMTAAVTAQIYFRTCQKKLSPYISSVLSIVYAFCGYGMFYYQNNIWLDMMYLFPLLMVAFKELFEKKRIIPYTVMLTLMMIVNYYISYMIVIFILLFMAVCCWRYRKEEKYKDVPCRFIIGSLLGALLSAVVWIPCFLQFLSSGRSKSVIMQIESADFFSNYQTTFCLLLSTASVAVIVLVFLLDGKKRSKRLNTDLIMLFLMLIPIIIEPANLMWHTGSYMSFPCRYAFITIFFALICAGYFLSSENAIAKEKKNCDHFIIFLILAALIYGFYRFSEGFVENNRDGMAKYTKSLWQDSTAFELWLEFFVVAAVFYTIITLLHKKGWISKKIFALFLAMFVAAESYANVNVYMITPDMNYPERSYYHHNIMDLSDRIEDNDGFYRVKTSSKLFEVNLVGSMGYNSLSHYTSLTSRDYMYMMKQLGYSSYWMEVGSYGGTELTDALLSVKYLIEKNDGITNNADSVYSNSIYEIVPTEYYLPLGIVTDADLSGSEKLSTGTRSDVQKKLFEQLFGGNGDELITDYEYDSIYGIQDDSVMSPSFTFNSSSDFSYMDYEIKVTDKQTLYFDCFDKLSNNLSENINGSFMVTVNGRSIQTDYPSQSSNGLLKLGEFENEEVNVRVTLNKNITNCRSYGVFGLHHDVLQKALEQVNTAGLTDNDGKLSGSVNAKAGQKCVLQIPYQEGLKIKVNGESVSYSKVFGDLVCFDLQEGENSITVTNVPKGFYAGLALTILGVALTVGYFFIRKKLKFGELLEMAGIVAVIGSGVIVMILVYIAPCILNIYS
ncbi:YfhO family protein [uncultured Ruminococcus sp.]|uniref:YfhO family protein n=1 Tax=uncultured Ruminococcus sp. TaxID=165186 RepID=UPI0025F98F97|nr:YfhO family protein [uncultured Ruminococcus sp.]